MKLILHFSFHNSFKTKLNQRMWHCNWLCKPNRTAHSMYKMRRFWLHRGRNYPSNYPTKPYVIFDANLLAPINHSKYPTHPTVRNANVMPGQFLVQICWRLQELITQEGCEVHPSVTDCPCHHDCQDHHQHRHHHHQFIMMIMMIIVCPPDCLRKESWRTSSQSSRLGSQMPSKGESTSSLSSPRIQIMLMIFLDAQASLRPILESV